MKLGNLKNAPGSNPSRKRIGRGEGSGTGMTAGRGEKGQHSRSGSKRRPWFEGGQMPLQRRLPKFGFVNIAKKTYQIINLSDLARIDPGSEITPEVLKNAGLVKHADRPIKLLGTGIIDRKVSITIHAISKSAKAMIEKSGGTVTLL